MNNSTRTRHEVTRIARKHKLPIADALELYDAFILDGMPELDAAVKALAITSVVNGAEPIVDDIDGTRASDAIDATDATERPN
jgi:hypothetical protein